MRNSWTKTIRRLAAGCVLFGATAFSSAMCYAINAFDSAADSVYTDGWQDGDNGGSGFTPWDFSSSITFHGIYYGQYSDSSFHAIDNGLQGGTHYSNPFNNIGRAWALGISPTNNGVPRAGRGFTLGIGQTLEVVIDNPTTREFFKGYTISLHGGTGGVDGNIGYQGYACNPPAMPVPKMSLGMFAYGPMAGWGEWYVDGVAGPTMVFDTDTAAAGAVFSVKRTAAETFDVVIDSLGGGADFAASGTFFNAGAEVDWIQFQIYNTPTDTATPPTTATDFYIKSMRIYLPGDVNFDGFVDIFDVNFVSQHWNETGPPVIPGDANNDGIVDIFDINLISSNWMPNPGGGSAVPEPSTWIGALVGVLGLGLGKLFAIRKNHRPS